MEYREKTYPKPVSHLRKEKKECYKLNIFSEDKREEERVLKQEKNFVIGRNAFIIECSEPKRDKSPNDCVESEGH